MPDPKVKKRTLDDAVNEAATEVLGAGPQPSNTSLTDDELLTMFGEKKKSPSEVSTSVPPAPKDNQDQIPEVAGQIPKPQNSENSGNGSLNQSGDWEGTTGQLSDTPEIRQEKLKQQTANPEEQTQLESASNTITRRFADLPNQLAESIAILGKKFDEIAPNPFTHANPYAFSVTDYLMDSAKKNRAMLDEIGVKDGDPRHPLTNSIATAVADLATMVATGGITKEAEALSLLNVASTKSAILTRTAGLTAKHLASPVALVAGAQIASQEYNQAINSGATEKQAVDVALQNWAVGGGLESIPVAQFFKRLDSVTGGGFKNYLKNVAINGTKQGGEEAITEIAQQFYSNVTAKESYDASRKLVEGMGESGGIGFGLGFVLGAMGVSLRKKQQLAATTEEKAEIQKGIDFIDQKTVELETGKLTDQGQEVKGKEEPAPVAQNSVQQETVNNVAEHTPVKQPIAQELTNNVEPTVENNDPQNEQRVQSDLGVREEPIQTESEQTASPEEINASGILQNTTEDLQNSEQQPIEKPVSKPVKIRSGKNNYNVKLQDGELQIRNKETKKYIPATSAQGKQVIEDYKTKVIHKFTNGKTVEVTPEMTPEDYTQAVISSSENPAEIAHVWNQQEDTTLDAKEQVIKDTLRRSPVESIYQFGDRNNVSNETFRNYTDKYSKKKHGNGTPLDVQAMEMASSSGLDITPQDLVDFIQKYPNGKKTAKNANTAKVELGNKFKSLTGLELTPEFAQEIADNSIIYQKQKENKFISNQELTDAIKSGEDLEKFKFLFDSEEDYTKSLKYVKKHLQTETKNRGPVAPQGSGTELANNTGTSEESPEVGQGTEGEAEVSGIVRSLTDQVGSLRNAQSDSEKRRIAERIIKEADGYLLNREGIMIDNDGSFALPNGKTFFDLLDEGKSVYYLDPNSKVAKDIFDYQIIANELPDTQKEEVLNILSEGEGDAISFDDAFRLGLVDKAKEMGYDGLLMKEIDGTDSTIQVLNQDAITLIHGTELRKSKQPIKESPITNIRESIQSNKTKTDINQMAGIVMMGDVLGINVNDITRYTAKGKDFFQKWLTSRGFIPETVFKSWLGTEGKINSELSKMKYTVSDFRKAVKDAYKPGFGKEVSTQVKSEINAALGGDKKAMAELPLEVQGKVSEMRKHVDYLSQRMIDEGIITGDLVAKFQENSGIYLFRSFRKHDDPDWVSDIDPLIVNRAKAYIEQQLPDLTNEEVDGVINELLYTPEAPMNLIKTGKLGSKDLSILKKRKDLAPEIRALYGEYTDPLVNYSKSIMKMINIIEKHKFLESVKSEGMGKFLHEKPTGKNHVQIAGESSSTMAPLNGLYTTPEIAQAFAEFNAKNNLPKWMEYYMKAISTVKAAKTVFNATTHARNVLGNLAFAVANGHYNLSESVDAFKTIKTDILNSDNTKFRETYRHYQELGIVGDSGSASELKAMLEDAKLKPDKFDYVNTRIISKAKKATTEFIGDLYQAEDDFYKIYAFENEFSRYSKAYPNKSKAEVEQISADIVKNTYPTYSKTAKIIKEMRKAPILGTFISFPAEVIRTTFNTAALTKQELSSDNKEVRSIGIQRLVGQLLSASITAGLSGLTKYLYGISDKEEEDIRKFVAPWSKNSLFFYIGPVKDGQVNMIDLSQTDPHGFWQKPIMAILDGNEDPTQNAIQAGKELLEPFLGLNMITEALINAKNNKKTTGQDITNTSLPAGDQALDYITYTAGFAQPGTFNSFERIYKGYKLQGHPDEYGKIYSFGNEVLAAAGGQRISSVDVGKSLSFLSGDMKDQFYMSKKIYSGFKLTEQPYMSESEKADIKEKRNQALDKSVEALKKDVKEMRKLYFGAQSLGVDAKGVKEIIKRNKLPTDLMKLVYVETPLDKLRLPSYKNGKNTTISVDEYLKKYLQKD